MPGLKTIYSRDGTPITDIRATVVRSSLLNDFGEGVFNVATSSIKCRREVLEYGNFIVAQNDALDDWVGIIDTPRSWKAGFVEVHCFEVPYILQYRFAPLNTSLVGTPGVRFGNLLNYANQKEDTLIRPGIVTYEGTSITEVITDSVYSQLKKMQSENNHDWTCTPVITSGKLNIIMNWLEKAGGLTDLELSQGHNVLYGDAPLEESGELINAIEALPDSQDGGQAYYYQEETAYGLREARKTYSGYSDTTALFSAAKEDILKSREPAFATPLTVINVGNTFANIKLGNIVSYKYTNVGFDASGLGMSKFVRIEGFRFDENLETCELFTGKV